MFTEIFAFLTALFFQGCQGVYYYRYYGYYYNRYYYYYSGYYYYYYTSSGYYGAIVGGVFGVGIFIAVICALICCCVKTKTRSGRVIIPANTGTVSYISGQPNATISYQTTTMTSGGAMAPPPPPYAYSNPAYPPGAVSQSYPNKGAPPPPYQAAANQGTNQGQGQVPSHPPPAQLHSPPTNPPMPQPDIGSTSPFSPSYSSSVPPSSSAPPVPKKE